MLKNILVSKKIVIIFLIVLMFLSFYINIFSSKNEVIGSKTFTNFQYDSEYLVLSKMYTDKVGVDTLYGLNIIFGLNDKRFSNAELENSNQENKEYYIKNYAKQFGLQGYIFSFLHNKLNISIMILKGICCLLLAIVLVLLSMKIKEKYKTIGNFFYLTFLLSPWIIAFAKNLYWVEFTWFIPALLGFYLSTNLEKYKIYLPFIFLAVLIKCLCGYEYITCIMLLTISPLCIDFFLNNSIKKRKQIFKITFIVGITCLLGFIVALLIHSYLVGNGNIFNGLNEIYTNEILKRTLDLGNYNSDFGRIGNIMITLKKYFKWNTNVLLGIPGNMFKPIFAGSFIIVIYNFLKGKKDSKRDIIMYFMFLVTSISWYILGTYHSFIHTHINFVLWYFGFLPMCFYIVFKFICDYIKQFSKENL